MNPDNYNAGTEVVGIEYDWYALCVHLYVPVWSSWETKNELWDNAEDQT